MTRIVFWLALVLSALTLAIPNVCHAQWDPAKQFAEGLERFDKGDFEGALTLFKDAHSRTSSPNARLYVARCLARLERYPEAYREMHATLEDASAKANEDDKYSKTRDAADAELKLLESKVAKLVVVLEEPFPDTKVIVNDREIGSSELGAPIVVAPGPVELKGTAPGKQLYSESFTLGAGETRSSTIKLLDMPTGDGGVEEDDGGPGLGTLRIIGIAVAGAGVVSLVVFAITGSMASKKFSEVEDCGMRCPAGGKYEELIDDGKSMQTIANVMLGVGIALSVGGAALIVFGGPDEDDAASDETVAFDTLRVGAAPLPGGAAVGLSGSF